MEPYLWGNLPDDYFSLCLGGKLNCARLSEWGAYLRDFLILKKLSKSATGKTNKAYPNVAPFSNMPNWNKLLLEILNAKVTNTFKLIQIQQKRSHVKCLSYCFKRMLLHWKRLTHHYVLLSWFVCSQLYQFLSSPKYPICVWNWEVTSFPKVKKET